jgi:hypothetical protein
MAYMTGPSLQPVPGAGPQLGPNMVAAPHSGQSGMNRQRADPVAAGKDGCAAVNGSGAQPKAQITSSATGRCDPDQS